MKILVTAGPTREAIDPVRFLSNRSSGRMGYAIAQVAADRGHEVCLVSGPVHLPAPPGVKLRLIETAAQMFDAVACEVPSKDIAILAAAVADYRPVEVFQQKLKKQAVELTLKLERTRDILGSMRDPLGFRGYLVGFAAETENAEANATEKLIRKDCDLIVANDVSRSDIGFDQHENEVLLCFRDGRREWLLKAAKTQLAQALVDRIEAEVKN